VPSASNAQVGLRPRLGRSRRASSSLALIPSRLVSGRTAAASLGKRVAGLPAPLRAPLVVGLRQASRACRELDLWCAEREDQRRLPVAVTTIDTERDEMFEWDNPSHYFSVGRSALSSINVGVHRAHLTDVRRILDVPCGHGRVLRMLHAQWPNSELTACDINRHGVDFCSRTFGAKGIYSTNPITDVRAGEGFDLVWVGSLLTHLDASRWPEFIDWLRDRLRPGGALIFTTHGEGAVDRVINGYFYGVDHDIALQHYQDEGFGYADYPTQSGYGVSFITPERVATMVADVGGLSLVYISVRGWDGHQDVVTCVRT
jgi:SAM-dependent methyltransferase